MANLIVNDVTPRVQYTATASQSVFAYPFAIFVNADLKVYLTPTGTDANDADDLITLTTDYTVSGAGTTAGGNVTLVVPATAGDIITIERDISVERTSDYQNLGDLSSEALNDDLDRLIMMVQQQESKIARSIVRASSSTTIGALVLPSPTAQAVLIFDDNLDLSISQELGIYQGIDTTTTTSSYSIRDLVKSTSAAELDNVYICIAASPLGTLLTNTTYWRLIVDAVSAAASAAAALASENNAAASETNALASEAAAAASEVQTGLDAAATAADAVQTGIDAAATALLYDNFDDRYLGAKSADPTLDNDGNALIDGALYFNNVVPELRAYDLGTTTWTSTLSLSKASTAQAEAGTDDAAYMTSLKTLQSIAANAPTPPSQLQATWNTGTDTTESLISALKLDAKIKTLAIGEGQLYAAAGLVSDTVYTNTSGRTEAYIVNANCNSSNSLRTFINGVQLSSMQGSGATLTPHGVIALIPDGSTYEFKASQGLLTTYRMA